MHICLPDKCTSNKLLFTLKPQLPQCYPGACFNQVYVWYLQLLYHVFILYYFLLCLVIYIWQDLRNNAYDWSRICHMDSDNDGRTNGDELGDPNCVWTTGTTPIGQASGHPGKHCEHNISVIGNHYFKPFTSVHNTSTQLREMYYVYNSWGFVLSVTTNYNRHFQRSGIVLIYFLIYLQECKWKFPKNSFYHVIWWQFLQFSAVLLRKIPSFHEA